MFCLVVAFSINDASLFAMISLQAKNFRCPECGFRARRHFGIVAHLKSFHGVAELTDAMASYFCPVPSVVAVNHGDAGQVDDDHEDAEHDREGDAGDEDDREGDRDGARGLVGYER